MKQNLVVCLATTMRPEVTVVCTWRPNHQKPMKFYDCMCVQSNLHSQSCSNYGLPTVACLTIVMRPEVSVVYV